MTDAAAVLSGCGASVCGSRVPYRAGEKRNPKGPRLLNAAGGGTHAPEHDANLRKCIFFAENSYGVSVAAGVAGHQ